MEKFRSSDGTLIAYERTGTGEPLVLVHGSGGDHAGWTPVLRALARRFAVYAIDRRGRGESGDRPDHSIDKEFDDIAAVVDAIGGPVNLVGHSYGALSRRHERAAPSRCTTTLGVSPTALRPRSSKARGS